MPPRNARRARFQCEDTVAGDDMQAAILRGNGSDGFSGQMVGLVEHGHGSAAVHPRNSIVGCDPEVFFAVEKEAINA